MLKCDDCGRKLQDSNALFQHLRDKHGSKGRKRGRARAIERDPELEPDWGGECEVCGSGPTVPLTGMCGPCTFGTADAVMGNW